MKRPLTETKCVDKWKCPYCRKIISKKPKAMRFSNFDIEDGEFEEVCPECGETALLFISPTFFARPKSEEDKVV